MLYEVRIKTQTSKVEAPTPRIAGKRAIKQWLKDNKPKNIIMMTSVFGAVDKSGRTATNHYNWRVK